MLYTIPKLLGLLQYISLYPCFLFIYMHTFVLICVLFYSVYFMSLFCVLRICVFCVFFDPAFGCYTTINVCVTCR